MSNKFKSILNCSVPISLLFLLLLVTIRAGGVELIQTEPVVCISDGCLRGTVLQNSVGSSYPAFLGIPFAKREASVCGETVYSLSRSEPFH